MTSGNETHAALLSQCLDFCHTLSSKSLTFSFALALGNSFSFHLDTNGKGALTSKAKKKNKTPSALRRNARRRAEFLKKKLEASTVDSTQSEHASVKETVHKVVDEKGSFKCNQCENIFKSENGLKIHIGKAHKKVTSTPSTPDQLRQQLEGSVSLSSSPLLDASREEFGLNFVTVEEKVPTPPSRPSTPPLPPSLLNTLCKKCDEKLHDYTCCEDQLELCHDCCNELRVCCYSD